jgi:transcriptional regulator
MQLTPDYVVGFVDGEGCFHVSIRGKPVFIVSNNNRDILTEIAEVLQVSNRIRVAKRNRKHPNYDLYVSAFNDIKLIVKFFSQHPPKVKAKDFETFREAFNKWEKCYQPKYSRRYIHYNITEDTQKKMKELYDRGWFLKDIADELKISRHVVQYYLYKKLRVEMRYCRGKVKRLSKEEIRKFIRLREQGLSFGKIGEILGRDSSWLSRLDKKLRGEDWNQKNL